MAKRIRKVWSVKEELLTKSREALLCSVQIFNNPNVVFKSESFIVLSNIAWTYLLHSYYREKRIDYRYFEKGAQRKKYDKTKRGSILVKKKKKNLIQKPGLRAVCSTVNSWVVFLHFSRK